MIGVLNRIRGLQDLYDALEERRNPSNPIWHTILLLRDLASWLISRDRSYWTLGKHNNNYVRKRGKHRKDTTPEILEIRNDYDINAGFFVQFMVVLNQLEYAEAARLTPVVNFDQEFNFFMDSSRGRNVWEYYFEPVADLSSDTLENMDSGRIIRLFPHEQAKRMSARNRIPDLNKEQLAQWYRNRRESRSELVKRYIRVKPHIQQKVERFVDRHMGDNPVLGVHVRGTDKGWRRDGRRYDFPLDLGRIVPPQEYWPMVDEYSDAHPGCKVFVATDQQDFLEAFVDRYGDRIIWHGDTRSLTGRNTMHDEGVDPYQKGEDVLVDCLLLARCHFLIRCMSNVGESATYFNPELEGIDLNFAANLDSKLT